MLGRTLVLCSCWQRVRELCGVSYKYIYILGTLVASLFFAGCKQGGRALDLALASTARETWSLTESLTSVHRV